MPDYTSEKLARHILEVAKFPKKRQMILPAIQKLEEVLVEYQQEGMLLLVHGEMVDWLETYANETESWQDVYAMAYQVCLAHCQWYDSQTMSQILRIMQKNAPDSVFLDIDEEETPRSAWEEVFFDLIISPIWNVVKSIFRLLK